MKGDVDWFVKVKHCTFMFQVGPHKCCKVIGRLREQTVRLPRDGTVSRFSHI